MPRLAKPLSVIALMLWGHLAIAQSTLGALLDAKARKLSAEEFKRELVQRVIVGPSPAGGSLEIMYTASGQVEGEGAAQKGTLPTKDAVRVLGHWTVDGTEKICTSLRFSLERGGMASTGLGMGYLPPRCQYWFKLGDTYFLSDSDSDRSAKVLSRTLKK